MSNGFIEPQSLRFRWKGLDVATVIYYITVIYLFLGNYSLPSHIKTGIKKLLIIVSKKEQETCLFSFLQEKGNPCLQNEINKYTYMYIWLIQSNDRLYLHGNNLWG